MVYPVAPGWPFVGFGCKFIDWNAFIKPGGVKGGSRRVKPFMPKNPITMSYHAPQVKAHDEASSKSYCFNQKKKEVCPIKDGEIKGEVHKHYF